MGSDDADATGHRAQDTDGPGRHAAAPGSTLD